MEQAHWGAKATLPARVNLTGIPCQHLAAEQVSVEDVQAVLEAYESKPRWVGSVCQVRQYKCTWNLENQEMENLISWFYGWKTWQQYPWSHRFPRLSEYAAGKSKRDIILQTSIQEVWTNLEGKPVCLHQRFHWLTSSTEYQPNRTCPKPSLKQFTSLTQWTWVWVNSGSWWWTGRPGVLQFMGSQRVRHDWVTELNWCLWSKNRM